MERRILHSDCNSFYASVECLHRPELRDKPVAVGGDVEQRHGIILAKNQLAKRHQIQTGEALWQAKQKCPDLIIVPPNFPLYLRFSRLAREIYLDYTDQVEPFGLDEAWLDVTGSARFGDGLTIAKEIKDRIKFELGITVSIGVSFNKVFAKLGSDYKKPDAITMITKENYKNIVWPLPAGDLLYVGKATERKLTSFGVRTIGELAQVSLRVMRTKFGKYGEILHCFANGLDFSPVERYTNQPTIQSIGNSTTPPRDLQNDEDVKIILFVLVDSVCRRLREQGLKARTVGVQIRDNILRSFTRQIKLQEYTNITQEIQNHAFSLFRANYQWSQPIRSIGVQVSDLAEDTTCSQVTFFEEEGERERKERLDAATDHLKRRFGTFSVRPAVMLQDRRLSGFDPKNDHVIHPIGFF